MNIIESDCSSVRFLESCSSSTTTEFLWLASSVIRNEKVLVILNEKLFKFSPCCFISVFLVVCEETFSNCHSHCHHLNHWSSTLNSNSNGEVFKSISSYNENRLKNFSSHWLWLNKMKGFSVHSNNSLSFLNEGNCCCILFLSECSNLFLFVTHYFFESTNFYSS